MKTESIQPFIQNTPDADKDVAELLNDPSSTKSADKFDCLQRLLHSAFAHGLVKAGKDHNDELRFVLDRNNAQHLKAWERSVKDAQRAARWVAAMPGLYKLAVIGVGGSLAFALSSVWPLVAALPLLWFGPKGGES